MVTKETLLRIKKFLMMEQTVVVETVVETVVNTVMEETEGGCSGCHAARKCINPVKVGGEKKKGEGEPEKQHLRRSHPTLELFQTVEQNEVALSLSSLKNLVRGCVNASMRVTQPPSRTNEVVCEVISRPPFVGNGFI